MARLPDWERRLNDYIASVRHAPFEWGTHDCALHACSAAAAMTGRDRAAEFRGVYSDRYGAAKALRELGRGTLMATLDALFTPIRPVEATRGDLVGFGTTAGVCLGGQAAFVGEENTGRVGLVLLPRTAWRKAWRV